MLRSLRARLLLAILGVAAVSLALAGWLFSRVTVVRFQDYQTTLRTEQQPEVRGEPLEEFFRRRGSWTGVETVLARMQEERKVRLVLVGPDRAVVAVSSPDLQKAQIEIAADGSIDIQSGGPRAERLRLKGTRPVLLRDGETNLGALHTLPPAPGMEMADGESPVPDSGFPAAVNRGLLGVIGLVLAFATAVALWLTRRIVKPVELLTAAVEKIRDGDLQQTVPAESGDEIGELGHAFNAMSEKLARIEQLRRDMVSDVAHELRTPLTNIRAQIEAVQDGLALPTPAVVASLHEEAVHLARLVDDLRDLSLADAGQLRIERTRILPANAMEQAIGALQPCAAQRGITVEGVYNGALPEVFADPVRLGQILRNLLENAIRHTPPNGQIVLGAHANSAQVEFFVRDSGAGIAAEHLPNIFERFYRTDPSRARESGGAGLGLAIVRQLVTAHGGAVRAQSTPGAGATFRFSIPLHRG